MPPRKGHRKSRAGCRICKRRRVKCDEAHPECGNCIKHGVRCDYTGAAPPPTPSESGATPSSSTASPAATTTTTTTTTAHSCTPESIRLDLPRNLTVTTHPPRPCHPPRTRCTCPNGHPLTFPWSTSFPGSLPPCHILQFLPNPAPPPPPLTHTDLSLLHHYITCTGHTASAHPDVTHVWATVFPELASSTPYLQHSLLAAAAAHKSLLALAKTHFLTALTLLQPELQHITAQNCHLVFAAASACMLYVFPASAPLSLEYATLTRATFGVLQQSWSWILASPVAPTLRAYTAPAKLSTGTEANLKALLELCTEDAGELEDAVTAAAYFLAVKALRKVYAALEESPRRPEAVSSAMFQYVLRVPGRFWEYVQERRGRALAVYAWYVVGWEAVGYWWTEGKAETELGEVEREVGGGEWARWVAGARAVWTGLKRGGREGWEVGVAGEETVGDMWMHEMMEMGVVGEWGVG